MDLHDLKGLIPGEVGEALQRMAGEVPEGRSIVEIGSFKGKSTCFLAAGARDGVDIFAVDPWDMTGNETGRFGFAEPSTREAFAEQIKLAGVEEKITPLQGFSQDVAVEFFARPKIGLLFIDGDHTYEGVVGDFYAWEKHLAPNAVVVFDDLDTPKNPGVRRAVDEIFGENRLGKFRIEAERLAIGESHGI